METTVPVCQTADIQLRDQSLAQAEKFKYLRILSVSEGRMDQVQDRGQSAVEFKLYKTSHKSRRHCLN